MLLSICPPPIDTVKTIPQIIMAAGGFKFDWHEMGSILLQETHWKLEETVFFIVMQATHCFYSEPKLLSLFASPV